MTKDRIVLLDALRGLGVLGILLCNAPDFAVIPALSESVLRWPHGTGPETLSVWAVTQWLFQRKFVTLFSMLFGVSLFLVGGERGDHERSGVLTRRLAWMAVFGLLHGFLLWYGDILLSYALAGLFMMRARSWSAGRLLKTGIVIWSILSVLFIAGPVLSTFEPAPSTAARTAKAAAAHAQTAAAFGGDAWSSLIANAKERVQRLAAEPVIVLMTSALMMIGLGCFKAGVLTGEASARTYRRLLAWGLASLVLLAGLIAWIFASHLSKLAVSTFMGVQSATAPLATLAYVSLMVLAIRSSGVWQAIPKLLAPVGRMAFSNYIAQSLIMVSIFYGGRGLSLFGKVDRPGLAAIVAGIWIAQILWSHAWMSRFPMGPLEWVWRRLYRGPQAASAEAR
ncbi:DUF418 domain-containing protein [Caulobacter sp. RHG1]|uniref:DUF418 domain-containing protein n=1 Tax=Caulobacter sp. (strain RHG1) TaxID=2545762 RepID=UPI0015519432|nr:DUF418 domain-containing protein [Caulobacter sp. RHG1]NQE62112.1 putative membrane protein [Caulobacter sp. RHG1]